MREITYIEAIREALTEELERDSKVFMLGEDIGTYGGAFGVSKGFVQKFGLDRIRNTPMSEAALVGVSAGCAIGGMRPIVEIMFMDFLTLCMDQLLNHAVKYHHVSNGQLKVPLVIRTAAGGGRGYGATHSQSLEPLLISIPGLKIVYPSTPYDAKGLLKASIRDNNIVIFIENKLLYATRGIVPEEEYLLPIGKAKVIQLGDDVTIITYSRYLQESIAAAKESNLSVEIVDLRSLAPLDMETISTSVKKTGKVIIIEEGCLTGGIGAEIASKVMENCFDYLDFPIQRVAAKDIPIPCSPTLEKATLPSKQDIVEALSKIKNR
ncbi:MAG: transketolase [archaeon GW2011_AR9]|nr:MAG: transketolase [archaeon GW2011_AR9]MBS3120653.1 alpha-ketoacid dehydrogenase subunit beta [Candidatus Woesearchaeota archaeon]HIG93670.1 alpha-ketoacid dehydrogenase subunit beta [Candidatus Woesearchaeota archaeon]HIH13011.1 alpha-ketoacid dehydrogenase subunit beta [Candidatus Woesearchaeota archaeon]